MSAGSNVTVSNVSVSSSTQLTATFTPTNSSSAGGNQSVTVTLNGQTSNSQNFFVQVPTYFFSPSAAQTTLPPVCAQEGAIGFVIDVSFYVADANGGQIKQSGMALGENVGSGWNDAFATPSTTRSDGSFDDTPVGACFATTGHFCAAGHPQSFRLTNSGVIFSIATNTTSKECTDGIQLVIQGNPTAQNKTYTFGNTQ